MELFKLLGKIAIDNTEAKTAIDDTTKKAKDAEKEQTGAFKKIGSAASALGKGMLGVGVAMGGAFVAAVEGTREYRQQMGLLESAFETAGHTSEEAKNTYSELNSVLGDTEQAVEASQHIALLADNEKEMQQWTDICTGVFATFGASLPVEGLTEAANHTAKLGEVQGSLADALEWSGITVDDFNEQLAKCSSEEERQDLIAKTLSETYKDASNQYKETNKDVIASQKAQERLTDAMAEVGAVGEPIMTAVKNAIADMAEKAAPMIQTVIDKTKDMITWFQENENTVQTWVGVILGASVAVGAFLLVMNWSSIMATASKAIGAVRMAVMAFNAALMANPIGIVVGLLVGLVAMFIYLWNNVDGFKEFWIDTWETIKNASSAAWEWIKKAASDAWEWIKGTWNSVGEWFGGQFDEIEQLGKDCMKSVSKFFSDAWNGIKKIWNNTKSYFNGILAGIKNTFKSVGSWFYQKFSDAWSNVKKAFSNWGSFFGGLWDSIKNKFSSIGSTLGSTMSNAVKTGMNAIIGKIESTINKGLGLINSAIRLANKLGFSVGEVGELSLPRLAKGAVVTSATPVIVGEDGAEAIIPLERNTRGLDMISEQIGNRLNHQSNDIEPLLKRVIALLETIERKNQNIYLDSGALVGELTPAIDRRLGYIATKKNRGNI